MQKSIKKSLAIFLSLIICIIAIPVTIVSAENATSGGLSYYNTGSGLVITGCDEDLTEVVIPDDINGNPVKSIENQAFIGCTKIKTITLGANVSNIANGAFSPCTGLRNIYVDENNDRFCDVDGVLYNYEMTKLVAHPAAKAQDIYVIPDTVVEILPRALAWCESINEIIIPDSVTTIGNMAFCLVLV